MTAVNCTKARSTQSLKENGFLKMKYQWLNDNDVSKSEHDFKPVLYPNSIIRILTGGDAQSECFKIDSNENKIISMLYNYYFIFLYL